ncbi:hypothetical protein [Ottowia thiooxydans]|uniref:Uncharacterized protein n=1 Tax=Ottowia thiooxydans TaxID=219182 RepID=A0ABV2Q3W5_9BURK
MPPGISPAVAPTAPFPANYQPGFTPPLHSNHSSHGLRAIQIGTGSAAADLNQQSAKSNTPVHSSPSFDDDFRLDFSLVEELNYHEISDDNEAINDWDVQNEKALQLSKLTAIELECWEMIKNASHSALDDFTNIILTAAGISLKTQSKHSQTELQAKTSLTPECALDNMVLLEKLEGKRICAFEKIQKIIDIADERIQKYQKDDDLDFNLTLATAINSHREIERIERHRPKVNFTTDNQDKIYSSSNLENFNKVFDDLNVIFGIQKSNNIDKEKHYFLSHFHLDISNYTSFAAHIFNEASLFNLSTFHPNTSHQSDSDEKFSHLPFEIILNKSQTEALIKLHLEVKDIISYYANSLKDDNTPPSSPLLDVNFVNTTKAPPEIEVMTETLLELLRYSLREFPKPTPLSQFYASHANKVNVFFQDH